ncbi:unnamed protein product [Adineta ricciae]|uniref:Uncharacterized protein n=1 Tax=Adineta ricciae TaxID=249248 RepID=A0A815WTX9_ADIRI|nr:unnamed protein product [Adineta ricciae]CAF1650565.1 unnamed protein product [Adineta ricciae]
MARINIIALQIAVFFIIVALSTAGKSYENDDSSMEKRLAVREILEELDEENLYRRCANCGGHPCGEAVAAARRDNARQLLRRDLSRVLLGLERRFGPLAC